MSDICLSAIIICFNEVHNIEACLTSLAFCDEIIVFDSGSTDGTVEVCRRYTDKIWVTDWPGDGPQKNRAFEKASGQWLLCVDADERISESLASEIKALLAQPTEMCAYDIPFASHYLGRRIRWGDWHRESHIRLLQKGAGQFTPVEVYGANGSHCRLTLTGRVGRCRHPMYHYPFRTLEQMIGKMNDYSTGSAALKASQGKAGGLAVALLRSCWSFLRGYILRLGFLDGAEGFLLAVSNAQGVFYRYLKVAEYRKALGDGR